MGGAKALADMLKTNETVQELYLDVNRVSDAGAICLADALKHNNTLKQLFLNCNGISDAGAFALAEGLEHNSQLECLNLQRNEISAAGVKALTRVASRPTSNLKTLYFSKNQITSEETGKIRREAGTRYQIHFFY